MIKKTRFIEPGSRTPFKDSLFNFFIYNRTIRNPSTGLMTLATIVKKIIDDTLMYSEAISEINFEDVYDSDIIFISINTYNAFRGYEIAGQIKKYSDAVIVFGGMHASLYFIETIEHCDYILTGDGDESIIEFIHALQNNSPVDFPGVIYKKDRTVVNTGKRNQPEDINTIPDRYLVHGYSEAAKRYDTLWPQVHASRGCPHNCSYCSIIHHFGRKIRKRRPENVVADIKEGIDFHKREIIPRFNTGLWITNDNFAQDREWAIAVLKEMIKQKIDYHFSVQARYEIGFDDEILTLMKQAGFIEITLGIEFLHDTTFKTYKKKSTHSEIIQSIQNIHAHGIGVRGLFIVGSDDDKKGIGKKIAEFVIKNEIHGVLIQSLFFTPGTPFYEQNKERLIHRDWSKYDGNVVHYPKNLKPHELQKEIIIASKKIYSIKKLLYALFHYKWFNKIIFTGEFFWHMNMRKELKKEIPFLKRFRVRKRR
jgi:radical SAM superfamily enzyme YgiQ (UPF0313 family)